MDKISYQEIDFLITVHRFKINYSYTRQKGMQFVREFLLRLIHIAPMRPGQIATYFGFSKIELNEAINNLVNKDELEFSDDGDVVLTPLSKGYFSKSGDSPEMLAFSEESIFLNYELVGFNHIKFSDNEDNRLGLKLQVDNEVIANSAKEVKTVFQKNFLKYFQDKVLLTRAIDREGKQPHLYSMGEVIMTGVHILRLSNQFSIDFDGRPIERSDFSELGDSSSVHDSITKKLSELQKPDNTEQVLKSMDKETKKFFNAKTFFDMKRLVQTRVELLSEKNNHKPVPFVGAIYLKQNWQLVVEQLKKAKDNTKTDGEKIPELVWIAPDDTFWGKSHRLASCISELINNESSKGKKAQRLYNTKIYLPLPTEANPRGRFFKQIEYDYKNFWEKNMSYLAKGFSNGNIEVILLPKSFVAVNYHLSRPDLLPVTLPIGFISTDIDTIGKVQNEIENFISDNVRNHSIKLIESGFYPTR